MGSSAVLHACMPDTLQPLPTEDAFGRLAAAGLFVGVGTSIANGCTSGHGISGLTRGSPRSLAATASFMAIGAATASLAGTAAWLDGNNDGDGSSGTAGLLLQSSGAATSLRPIATAAIIAGGFALTAGLLVGLALTTSFRRNTLELASGITTGLGLGLSGMTKPSKVARFLDLSNGLERWDPTLAFVMGGALCITVPCYHIFIKGTDPVWAAAISLPTNNIVDAQLLLGASLFGCGWGLAGICPGPGLVAGAAAIMFVPEQRLPWLVFLSAMLLGWLVVPRVPHARSLGKKKEVTYQAP